MSFPSDPLFYSGLAQIPPGALGVWSVPGGLELLSEQGRRAVLGWRRASGLLSHASQDRMGEYFYNLGVDGATQPIMLKSKPVNKNVDKCGSRTVENLHTEWRKT